jgi:hypothetical protein
MMEWKIPQIMNGHAMPPCGLLQQEISVLTLFLGFLTNYLSCLHHFIVSSPILEYQIQNAPETLANMRGKHT